jgi:hypothetical protein
MKSFDEATRQVAGLMAAIGGNVDAYEDDQSSGASHLATTFDAAVASVEAQIQHNEPRPPARMEIVREIAGVTEEEHPRHELEDYSAVEHVIQHMNEQLDTVDQNPFEAIEEETITAATAEEEMVPTEADLEVLAEFETLMPETDCEDMQPDGKFWMCMLEGVYLPQVPLPVEPCYTHIGSVYKDGHEELKEIHDAFLSAIRTGEPQTVTLDSGTYEMTQGFGENWELYDTGKGRKYCQESVWQTTGAGDENHYDLVEEEDLFLWVIPDERDDVDDLGYLHNRWVFLRE